MSDGKQYYWFGGSPCAGKSSIADILAARHDMTVYRCDDAFDAHMNRSNPAQHPALHTLKGMSWEEIWMRPVPVQVDSEFAIYREEFGMILDDLQTLPTDRPILVEGCALLPELVATQIANPRRALWFVPVPEFQRTHYAQRDFTKHVLAQVSDPDLAWDNWMNRDQQFGERVAADATARSYRVEWVDGSRSIDALSRMVATHYQLRD